MSIFQHISPAEAGFIRRYFDGIDHAVARELVYGKTTYEEFLTATLGRLMDQHSPFQSLLDYPHRKLSEDLDACGSGNHTTIEFETHEHSKSRANPIRADLGIILKLEGSPHRKPLEKAVLVESKRLYPTRNLFRLSSEYEAYKDGQQQELIKVEQRFISGFVYYFLYNPTLSEFDERSAAVIRAYENQNTNRASLIASYKMHLQYITTGATSGSSFYALTYYM